jgi:predicted nucleotidyltransferase
VDRNEILKKLIKFQDESKNFYVRDLYIFGSYAREEALEQSDLDILVDFEPEAKIGLFEFARLRRRLSEFLGREVDLVTRDALRPEMRDEILREAVHAS